MNFLSELTGSFAMPAAENPTVAMIEAAYQYHQLDWRYINCEVPPEKLGDAVRGARAMNWAGFNCSIPHKVAVIEYLDGLGQSAALIGAVNCVVRRGEQYIGENTDGKGFLQSLQTAVSPQNKRVVLFGAGGAARAISVELALAGVEQITVVNRSRDRGQGLVNLLNGRVKEVVNGRFQATLHLWQNSYTIPADTDIVINATSIGLYPDIEARLDIDADSLRPTMLVADVIPNPPQTNLLKDAAARGCAVLDGMGMLVNQGVIGVQYWTGLTVDSNVMHAKLTEIFGV